MGELNGENEGYIPGTCNIGKEEFQRRKITLAIYIALTFLCIALMQFFHIRHIWRLLIFIPSATAVISAMQVYYHFCVNFGVRGVFNFGKLGKTSSPELDEYIRKDRAKAWRMVSVGIVAGIAIAVIYFFLPV